VVEVSKVFDKTDALVCLGARLSAESKSPTEARLEKHGPFVCGVDKSDPSARTTGITVMLSSKLFKKARVSVEAAPGVLQGRGAFLRAKYWQLDISVIGAYFPPRSAAQENHGKYCETVRKLSAWISSKLSGLPQRTLPVVAMYLNDSFGISKSGGEWHYTHGTSVGVNALDEEHLPAKLVRGIMEENFMSAPATFWPTGYTYFGTNGGWPNIDHIFIPAGMMGEASRAPTLPVIGKTAQLTKHPDNRDHVPLEVVLRYEFGPRRAEELWPETYSWDLDKLGLSLDSGIWKKEFVEAVDTRLEDLAPAGVDEAWERLVDVVKEEAKKYYSRDGRSESEDTKRMKEQRRELLRLRAEKRQELSHEKYEEVCEQLRELDKVIKGRKKEYEERVREAAGHQVAEDWRSRRMSSVYRGVRRLANKGLGPKRRRLGVAPGQLFDNKGMEEQLVVPARLVGFRRTCDSGG
jgi:hypothetical protein